MLLFRRSIAALVGTILLPTLIVALFVFGLNDTFLKPSFYPQQLEKRGVYQFLVVDLLASVLNDVRAADPAELGVDVRRNVLAESGLTNRQILEAVHLGLSPQKLEAIVAPIALAIGQIIAGEQDQVAIRIDATEPVRGMVDGSLELLREAGTYEWLLRNEIRPFVRDRLIESFASSTEASNIATLSFGGNAVASERLAESAVRVITPEWIAGLTERSVRQVSSYLIADSDGFEVQIRITEELTDATAAEFKAILGGDAAIDLLSQYVIAPAIEPILGVGVEVPFGQVITSAEVTDALLEFAPPDLVDRQAEIFIEDASDYLLGRSDGFTTQISIEPNKQAAQLGLTGLADQKVTAVVNYLPDCESGPDIGELTLTLENPDLPACLPPGIRRSQLLDSVTARTASLVQTLVLDPLPDSVVFSESHLRDVVNSAGGPGALEALDEWRRMLAEGYSYDQTDLREDLAAGGNLADFDDIRTFFADGYVFSIGSLEDEASEDSIGTGLQALGDASRAVRQYGWISYLVALGMLVVIGLLGGISWPGRIAWASAVLFIAALTLTILLWPVFEAASAAGFSAAREGMIDLADGPFAGTSQLSADYVLRAVQDLAGDLVSSVRWVAGSLAAVALAGWLGALAWDRRHSASFKTDTPH